MQCQHFLNRQNNNKNKPKYILLIVLTKMDKIGVSQKKSTYFDAEESQFSISSLNQMLAWFYHSSFYVLWFYIAVRNKKGELYK